MQRTQTLTQQHTPQTAPWPDGVIARYLTVGGATVDLIEQSGYYTYTEPTETYAVCSGCPATHTVEWGFSPSRNEFGQPQPDTFDKGGKWSTPKAREWAQAHAEKCRALPRPAVPQ